jgi:hypothetical protein
VIGVAYTTNNGSTTDFVENRVYSGLSWESAFPSMPRVPVSRLSYIWAYNTSSFDSRLWSVGWKSNGWRVILFQAYSKSEPKTTPIVSWHEYNSLKEIQNAESSIDFSVATQGVGGIESHDPQSMFLMTVNSTEDPNPKFISESILSTWTADWVV